MSKQVDSRVVEMQFDNKHFEANVKTTMSTLDKLKQSLQFKDASKGFDNLNSSAKKVDMTHLGKGLETCRAKFSALEVMGVTALANITNSAVNAGKRIVKAFTVDPIKTGFNEYELKMGAIQTIMASTGENLDVVNKKLNELNTYSDQTIYSFQDMTQNIGKFTNAGVKLDDAVMAIKGVSNEAAISGANANEASRAMYNFAQALSAGYVKLIDWKSIENANMSTVEFKNQLIETAVELGTLTKKGDMYVSTTKDANGSVSDLFNSTKMFNESLSAQWMTSEVLVETLKEYADENTAIGKKAKAAATEVKTFSMMMDTLKESAQSGWAQTWEIIVGDFNEAKGLFTRLSNFFGGIIEATSKFRNMLLEGALGKTFTGLSEKIQGITKPLAKTGEAIATVTETVKNYDKVVNEILGGVWDNGQARFDKLTEAGYDWAHAQNLVNEKLGSGVRHATNYKEAQDDVSKAENKATGEAKKLSKAEAKRLQQLAKMSDAELKAAGYTKEQISAFRELGEEADKLGMSVSEFVLSIDELSGRSILLKSFENIGNSIVTVFKSMATAWKEIFPPATSEQLYNVIAGFHKLSTHFVVGDDTADKLTRTFKGLFAALDVILTITSGPLKLAFKVFTELLGAFDLNILDVTAAIGDAIVGFNEWLDSVLDFGGVFEKLRPYLEGFIDTISQWKDNLVLQFEKVGPDLIAGLRNGISSGVNIVWDAIVGLGKKILQWFKDVLGVKSPSTKTYAIGEDTVAGFVNAVKDSIGGVLSAVGEFCSKIIETFTDANWEDISDVLLMITTIFKQIPGLNIVFALSRYFASAGSDIAGGLFEGLKTGFSKIGSVISEIATKLITTFCDILGIQSPSTVFIAIGGFIISGLLLGLTNNAGNFWDLIKTIITKGIEIAKIAIEKFVELFKSMDVGSIIAVAISAGILFAFKKTYDLVERFADIAEMFVAPLKGLGKALSGIGNAADAFAKEMKSKAILNMAIAIGILAASLWVLSKIDWKSALIGTAYLGALIVAVVALATVANTLTASGASLAGLAGVFLGIAAAVGIMALIVKSLSTIEEGPLIRGTTCIGFLMIFIGLLAKSTDLIQNDIKGVGTTFLAMAASIYILARVIKMLGKLSTSDVSQGIATIYLFGVLIAGLMAATKLAGGNAQQAGLAILAISGAITLMASAVKKLGKLDPAQAKQGLACMAALSAIIAALIWSTKLAGNGELTKVASVLIAMGVAIGILALVIRMVGGLSVGVLIKGLAVIAVLQFFVRLLVNSLAQYPKSELQGVSKTLMAMSLSIAILAGVIALIGMLDVTTLAKGLTVVGILGLLVIGFTKALQGANDIKGTMTMLAVAIGVMALSIAGLSCIEPEKLAGATAAIAILMGMFALMTKMTDCVYTSWKSMLIIVAVVGLLTGLLWAISALNIEASIETIGSLSLLMVSLGAALRIISTITVDKSMVGKIGALTAMGVPLIAFGYAIKAIPPLDGKERTVLTVSAAIAAMSGVLKILSTIKASGSQIGTLFATIGALTTLCGLLYGLGWAIGTIPDCAGKERTVLILAGTMAAMTVLLLALTGIGTLITGTIGMVFAGIGALTVLCGLLYGLGWAIGTIPDCSGKEKTVIILTQVMAAMTVLLAVLSVVGLLAIGMIPGVVGLVALCGLFYGLGWAIHHIPDLTSAKPSVEMLLQVMTTLTDVLTQVSEAGLMVVVGLAAINGLILVMTRVAVLATAIGQLAEWFGTGALDTGLKLMIKLADGIGQMLGAFIGGIIDQVSESLPGLGKSLGEFADGAGPFLTMIKDLDESVATKTKHLADAIVALTKADFISGLLKWRQNGDSFAAVGSELSTFAYNAGVFFETIKGIAPENITSVKALAEAVKIMTETDLMDGINAFADENDSKLAKFGKELEAFGEYVEGFSEATEDVKPETMKPAAEAAKLLAEMASSLPASGGWKDSILGSNDMDTFGSKLVSFGYAITDYCTAVNGITTASVKPSVNAAKQIIDMANSIPETGGFISWFTGDNSLKGFGNNIKKFGEGLKAYCDAIVGINADSVTPSIGAAKELIELSKLVPETQGFWGKLFANSDMSTFGKEIKKFGKALCDYSESVADVDPDQISKSIGAAEATIALVKSLSGFEVPDLTNFETACGDIAGVLEDFSGLMSMDDEDGGVDSATITAAMDAAQKVADLLTSLSLINTDGVATFKTAVNDLATVNLNSIVEVFTGADAKLQSIGSGIIDSMIAGINLRRELMGTTLASVVSMAVSTVSADKEHLTSVGTSLVSAITGGITTSAPNIGTELNTAVSEAANKLSNPPASLGQFGTAMINAIKVSVVAEGTNLKSSITTLMNECVAKMNEKKSAFKTAGETLMDGLKEGIEGKLSDVQKAAKSIAKSAAGKEGDSSGVYGGHSKWKSSGKYLIDGLIAGLKDKTKIEEAKSAAADLGTAVHEAYKAKVGERSPAKKFIESGMYIVQGLANGLNDYGYLASDASRGLGVDMIKAIQEYLGIHSPATLARDEVGRYYAQGIAEGITKDMSAEEAAEKKAQNITDAFQKEFDKFSLDRETTDLQYKLWESLNPNASESEKAQAKINFENSKLSSLRSDIKLYYDMYSQMVKEFGASSKQAQEAENKLYTAVTTYTDTLNGIEDSRQTMKDDYAEKIQNNIAAYEEYKEFLTKWKKTYLDIGRTLDELDQDARKVSGYDPTISLDIRAANDIGKSAIISGESTIINPYLQDVLQKAEEIIGDTSVELGGTYISGISAGISAEIQNGSPQVVSTISTTLSSCASSLQIDQTNWVSAGEQLVNGLVQGIRNGTANMNAVITEMITAAYTATSTVLSGEGNVSLTIRPVVDMSRMNDLFINSNGELALAGITTGTIVDRLDNINATLYNMRTENTNRGNKIISTIADLKNDLRNVAATIDRTSEANASAIRGMSVKMNSGAVVGEIITEVDNGLGSIATHKGRGN